MKRSVSRMKLIVPALVGLSLAACETTVHEQKFDFASDRYAPQVVQVDEAYDFAPASYAGGMSPSDRSMVARQMAMYAQSGRGSMVVSYPRNSDNAKAAAEALAEMRAMAPAYGVDPAYIQAQPYEASGQNRAPMSIRFARLEAKIPECGTNWSSLTKTAMNEPHPNFGCAVNANIAAMVADPSDLIGAPPPMGPPDPGRRAAVLEAYRAGEATGAERADNETGTVSSAVE